MDKSIFGFVHYKTRLDRPGEPKIGTRDPGGQPQRAPECSDGLDGSDGWVPGRDRGYAPHAEAGGGIPRRRGGGA